LWELPGRVLGRFFYTTDEKAIDLGPTAASVDGKQSVAIADIAGIGAILVGALLLYLGHRKA
jgi:hypothetical protein